MLTGDAWKEANASVDRCIDQDGCAVTADDIKKQIERTANAFAEDMLATKFVQGLPIVGVIGDMMNPVYYNRVMSYVQLKYRKRYLIQN